MVYGVEDKLYTVFFRKPEVALYQYYCPQGE